MSDSDPVSTPEKPVDEQPKKYDDMTAEERAEHDRLQRKREEEEQNGLPSICSFVNPTTGADCSAIILPPRTFILSRLPTCTRNPT